MMKRSIAIAAALSVLGCLGWSNAQAQAKLCDKPRQMDRLQDLRRCREGRGGRAPSCSIRPIPRQGQVKLLASFNKAFPKIKTNYVRLQAGALYAKLLSERQAKSYLVDVIQISDMGMILDFQKRGGFMQYISPEMAAFKPEYQEHARGLLDLGLGDHGRHRLQSKQHAASRGAEDLGRPARPEMDRRDQRQGLELGPAARRSGTC